MLQNNSWIKEEILKRKVERCLFVVFFSFPERKLKLKNKNLKMYQFRYEIDLKIGQTKTGCTTVV